MDPVVINAVLAGDLSKAEKEIDALPPQTPGFFLDALKKVVRAGKTFNEIDKSHPVEMERLTRLAREHQLRENK